MAAIQLMKVNKPEIAHVEAGACHADLADN
jgi:hypothetical protein